MNSNQEMVNLTELVIKSKNVKLTVHSNGLIFSVFAYDQAAQEYYPANWLADATLKECASLDLVKKLFDMIQVVGINRIPFKHNFDLHARQTLIPLMIDVIPIQGEIYGVSLMIKPEESFLKRGNFSDNIIDQLLDYGNLNEGIRIILDEMLKSNIWVGGGILIYMNTEGEISNHYCSGIAFEELKEIHARLMNSPYWVNLKSGHLVFINKEKFSDQNGCDNSHLNEYSILLLPVISNNELMGNIILFTQADEASATSNSQLVEFFSWINRILARYLINEVTRMKANTFSQIINQMQDASFAITKQGNFLFANSAFQSILKYSADEFLKLQIEDIAPDFFKQLQISENLDLRGKEKQLQITYFAKGEGQILLKTKVMVNSEGLISGIIEKDPLDEIQPEFNKEEIIQVAENITQPALLIDGSTQQIIYANPYAHLYYDYPDGALVDQNFIELFSMEERQTVIGAIQENGFREAINLRTWQQKTKNLVSLQTRYLVKSVRIRDRKVFFLLVQPNKPQSVPSMIREGTDFYNLLNQDLLIVRMTPDGFVTHVNQRFCDVLGKPKEKLIGKSFEENLFVEDYGSIFHHFSLLTSQNPIRKNTNRLLDGQGKTVWVEWTDRGVFAEDELTEIYSIGKDITAEIQQDMMNKSAEQRYQALVETLPLLTYVVHATTFFPIYLSPQIKEFTGYEVDDFYKEPDFWRNIIFSEDLQKYYQHLQRRIEAGVQEAIEFRLIHKDGHLVCVEEIGLVITLQDGTRVFQGTVRDITEEHKTKVKLNYFTNLEHIINEASLELMEATPANYPATLTHLLRKIGEFMQVDRAYIFDFDFVHQTMSNTIEWCAPGISPQIDNLQSIPFSYFPWWMEQMHTDQVITLNNINDLPPEASNERAYLPEQQIQSLLAVPMVVSHQVKGFIGFDMVSKETHWETESINLLRLLSSMILNTNERLAR